MGTAVRLHLDAVGAPVRASLAHRSKDRMVVLQALPFLRLDSAVRDEEGRPARIRDVRLDVLDGTPSLVLDLAYDGHEQEPFRVLPREDDTWPGFVPEMPDPSTRATARRRDETVSFETERSSRRCEVVVSDPPPALRVSRWMRLWVRFTAWMRHAEILVDRMLATRTA